MKKGVVGGLAEGLVERWEEGLANRQPGWRWTDGLVVREAVGLEAGLGSRVRGRRGWRSGGVGGQAGGSGRRGPRGCSGACSLPVQDPSLVVGEHICRQR